MKKESTNKIALRAIFGYLRPYKKISYAIVVLLVLQYGSQLVAPVLFGKIVDLVTQTKTFNREVFLMLLAWIFLDVLSNYFNRIKMKKSAQAAYGASSLQMVKMVAHLMRLPLSYHKEKKVGEVIQSISRANNQIYGFIEDGLFATVPYLLMTFLALGIIAWINPLLALWYGLFLAAYVIISIWKTKPLIKFQKKINRQFEKIFGNIIDRVPNILTIKANTAEETENERNRKGYEQGKPFIMQEIVNWNSLQHWQNWIKNIGFMFIFGWGLYLVSMEKITIGQFIMLLTYVNMCNFMIFTLAWQYKRLQEGFVTIARAEELLQKETEKYGEDEGITISECKGKIQFKNVAFAYDSEKVLDEISFVANPGQMVAIVGKSGEGKSTLVSLISRYHIPQSGKILLDGIDIQKIRLENLRGQIAIVPQEVDLFNDTITENIRYSNLTATDEQVIVAAKKANCHEFIEKFPKKYQQLVGERGVKLSTGQKQRVAIARAILRNPKILILDEATSALDSESEQLVQTALNEVMQGRTTFVIAHRLSTIRKADLILVLENGKIVESGDHQELIGKGGVYQKLSELQQINV